MTTNTGTRTTHVPYDGCDDCDRNLMDVAMAEYRTGKWVPLDVRRIKEGG